METRTNRHVIPAADFSNRPPSPPAIVIGAHTTFNHIEPIKVVPSYADVDPTSLSLGDLEIITQNRKEIVAHDNMTDWVYESRRTAQPILEFLYLGPSSVARDRNWLREHGITMLLAARDAHMADLRIMAVDRVAAELGIQAEHVDVSGYHELIRAFPSTVRKINDHMLSIYRSHALDAGATNDGTSMVIDQTQFRRGRVLVFCETGNDRSAGIVVAYLMSLLGIDMLKACQIVHYKRFCVSLNEELKQILQTYQDILVAQRTVHRHEMRDTPRPHSPDAIIKKTKRTIDDVMDLEDKDLDMNGDMADRDRDRFQSREAFVPFIDIKDSIT